MMDNFTLDLADEAATLSFGAVLAMAIQPNLTIYLHGDLGAGKTTLVRGLLHALGYMGKVKSPTYTLVECYEIAAKSAQPLNIYHFDLYRFHDDEEWEAAGFRDYFNANSVCLIEWPEKAQQCLPLPDLDVIFSIQEPGRTIKLIAHTPLGQQSISSIKAKSC
jgi:tRNA threonylcarbamoyladenosine biosynthesis protein TsaE